MWPPLQLCCWEGKMCLEPPYTLCPSEDYHCGHQLSHGSDFVSGFCFFSPQSATFPFLAGSTNAIPLPPAQEIIFSSCVFWSSLNDFFVFRCSCLHGACGVCLWSVCCHLHFYKELQVHPSYNFTLWTVPLNEVFNNLYSLRGLSTFTVTD